MKRFLTLVVVAMLIAGAALAFFYIRARNETAGPEPSPSASVRPSFALTGEIIAIEEDSLTILFQKRAAVSSEDLPEYETRVTPISDTTLVVRRATDAQGNVTEVAVPMYELTVGQDVTVLWAEENGPALFPQKITIVQ